MLTCADLGFPRDVKFYNGKLIVTDYENNRVLIWNSVPTTNYVAADIVVGQPNCQSNSASPVTASSLNKPYDVLIYPGSPDKLLVSDFNNNRVLVWNSFPTTHGTAADLVLGQPGFTSASGNWGGLSMSSLALPIRLATNGTKLLLSDLNNNRILIWNTFPTINKQAADIVVGQASGTVGSANQGLTVSGQTLQSPSGIDIIDGDLWLADTANQRVLKYNGIPTVNNESAVFVLGQSQIVKQNLGFNSGVSDLIYNRIYDVDLFNNQLSFVDFGANRILKMNSIPTQAQTNPDLIYGQDSSSDTQTRRSSYTTTGRGFNDPSSIMNIVVNGVQKTVISDTSNNRVLIYDNGILDNNDEPEIVLGQLDFVTRTSNTNGLSMSGLYAPLQTASDGTRFAVVDYLNNRILIWNSFPTNNFQSADIVLGQPNSTSNTANNGGLSASTLSGPRGVAFINDKLYVADTENGRILIWNSMPTVTGQAADEVIGQTSMNTFQLVPNNPNIITIKPGYLFYYNGQLFNMDLYLSRVFIWDQLPTQSDQIPDREAGGHLNLGFEDDGYRPTSIYTNSLSYSVKSDGERLFIPDYSGQRLVIREMPEVSVTGNYNTKNQNVPVTIHNCYLRSKVMFNESVKPSADSPDWKDCVTTKNHYSYNLSSGDGVKNVKIWFKDEEGNVLESPLVTQVFLNTRIPLLRGVALSTSSPTNLTNITFSSTVYKNDSQNSPVKYFISESSAPPAEVNQQWVDISATNSYTLTNSTNEIKTIYVWGSDSVGNITDRPTVMMIKYDNTPPMNTPSAMLSGHFLSQLSPVYYFTMNNCTDAASILVTETSSQPSSSDPNWKTCSTNANAVSLTSILPTFGVKQFYIWSKDAAGNISVNSYNISSDYQALLTIGQSSSDVVSTASTSLSEPRSVDSNGTKFLITDNLNSRVLIYEGDPTTTSPSVVLGQTALDKIGCNNGGVSASTLCYPMEAVFAGSKIIVADYFNHRVLIWNSIPSVNGAPADVVLGQQNMTSSSYNLNTTTKNCSVMYNPSGVWSDGTVLTVGDFNNNRILFYNTIPTVNYAAADFVVGQATCSDITGATSATVMKNPSKAIIAENKLIVSDRGNNRILIYNTLPTGSGATADVVLGQLTMTSATGAVTSTGLKGAGQLSYVNGLLYVADVNNGRVLVYNGIPTANATAASVVIGKSTMTATTPSSGVTGLNIPTGLYVDSQYLWVADPLGFKIKRFTLPLSNGQSSTAFLGGYDASLNQTNIRTTASTSSSQLSYPLSSIIVGTKLIVSDYISNRVLIWNTLPTTSGQSADVVLGQPDMTSTTANNTAITDLGARLNKPFSVFSDGTKLYIADNGNNRVLVYNTIPTTNAESPSFILGQANFTSVGGNRGGSPGLDTLYGPTRIYANANRLYIADSNNHRVLLWSTIPTTTGTPANYVIGQTTVTARTTGIAQNRFNNPQGIVEDNNKLYVADSSNHRLLVWNSIPTANGVNADYVIGQSNFTSNTTALNSTGFNTPRVVKILNNKLFVVDVSNHRIMVWNSIPTASGVSADHIIGQNLSTRSFVNYGGVSGVSYYIPYDIDFDGTYYWLTEAGNHRVIKLQLSF